MKLNGKKIETAIEIVVIPRSTGDLVFKAKAISAYDDFNKLCPTPVPPTIKRPGQPESQDTTDPAFKKAMDLWASAHTNWMIIESLKATEGLEWETVIPNDPGTWGNFQNELESSGLAQNEIIRIVNIVLDANGLNDKKIEAATKAFLASTAATPAGQ